MLEEKKTETFQFYSYYEGRAQLKQTTEPSSGVIIKKFQKITKCFEQNFTQRKEGE